MARDRGISRKPGPTRRALLTGATGLALLGTGSATAQQAQQQGAWLDQVQAAAAQAPSAGRKALVIGNGTYMHGPDLKNPIPDARAVGLALEGMGFTVYYSENLTLRSMGATLGAFARVLEPMDTAIVFFAGHGVLVDGATYLMPTDALMRDEHDLITAVPLNEVLDVLRQDLRAAMVLVDACRDNPLLQLAATRSLRPQSSVAETLRLPFGMVISYAAQPGAVAYDGDGNHSPYVTALLQHMTQPGADVELMLRAVRRDVVLSTGGAQVPWTQSSLLDGFSLSGQSAAAHTAPAAAPVPDPARVQRRATLKARLCTAIGGRIGPYGNCLR